MRRPPNLNRVTRVALSLTLCASAAAVAVYLTLAGQTAPAQAAPAEGGTVILQNRVWSADGKVPTGTIWRTFESWQTDVARTEKGDLVNVDPICQRIGRGDKGEAVRIATNAPGYTYGQVKVSKVEINPAKTVHSSPLPPANWQAADFDDGSWTRDPCPERQLYGLVRRLCMRGRFDVTNPGEMELTVRFRGGAVAYLNGKEIGRASLPKGELKDDTMAEDYPKEAYVDAEGVLIGQGVYGQDTRDAQLMKARNIEHGLLQWNGTWKWRSVGYDDAANGYFGNKDPQVVERYRSRARTLNVKILAADLRKGVNVLAIEIRRAPAWEGMFTSSGYGEGGKKTQLAFTSFETWWDRCELEDLKLVSHAAAAVPNIAPAKGTHIWAHPAARDLDASFYGDPNETLSPIRLRGMKNGTYSGQVVVGSSSPIKGISAVATELKAADGGTIPMTDIQIGYPWIIDGAAGDGGGFICFDPLEPTPPKDVADVTWSAGRKFPPMQPVWITVKVPRDAKAGTYKGTLTVNVGGEKATAVPVELEVIGDWVLPDATAFHTDVSLLECPDAVAKLYKVPMWSEEHWKLLDKVFEIMGQMGVKDIYIPMISKTHLGNPDSMVRYVKQPDGTYKADTAIAERYIDLAVKRLGKIPRVCIYTSTRNQYDPPASRSKNEPNQPICSEYDPQTKQCKDFFPPKWGSEGSVAFWKPIIQQMKDVLTKRGLEKSMMFGYCCDGFGPAGQNPDGMPAHFADLYAISPQTKWVVSAHLATDSWTAGKKLTHASMLGSHSWMFGRLFDVHWMDDSDTPFWKQTFGWRDKTSPVELAASRSRSPTHIGEHCPNVTRLRVVAEATMLSKTGGLPFQGFGEWGADFWANEWQQFDAYGNVALSESTMRWMVGPGHEFPIPTCRTRMMQESLQEAEMRIIVQDAVLDGKLPGDLAKRAKELCDSRTRAFTYMSTFKYSDGTTNTPRLRVIANLCDWDDEFTKLARMADEVAKVLKK